MNERKSQYSSYIQVQANMRFTVLTSSIIAAFSLIVAATPMPEVFFFYRKKTLPIAHFA